MKREASLNIEHLCCFETFFAIWIQMYNLNKAGGFFRQTIDGREVLNYLSPFPRRLNKWHHKILPTVFLFLNKGSFWVGWGKEKKSCFYKELPSTNPKFGSVRFQDCLLCREEKGFPNWSFEASKLLLWKGHFKKVENKIVYCWNLFLGIVAKVFSNYCLALCGDKKELRNVGL